MRHLIQIFYFLGSIPGLAFFNRIAQNFGRLEGVSYKVSATKKSVDQLKNKDKDKEEKKTESRW